MRAGGLQVARPPLCEGHGLALHRERAGLLSALQHHLPPHILALAARESHGLGVEAQSGISGAGGGVEHGVMRGLRGEVNAARELKGGFITSTQCKLFHSRLDLPACTYGVYA